MSQMGRENFVYTKRSPVKPGMTKKGYKDPRLRGDDENGRGARPHFLQQANRDFTDFSKIGD